MTNITNKLTVEELEAENSRLRSLLANATKALTCCTIISFNMEESRGVMETIEKVTQNIWRMLGSQIRGFTRPRDTIQGIKMTDNLTIEEVELFYHDIAKNEEEILLAKQLLETMRENERMVGILSAYKKIYLAYNNDSDCIYDSRWKDAFYNIFSEAEGVITLTRTRSLKNPVP